MITLDDFRPQTFRPYVSRGYRIQSGQNGVILTSCETGKFFALNIGAKHLFELYPPPKDYQA